MKFKIDHGWAHKLHAVPPGKGHSRESQIEIFPEIPDSPFCPVPGMPYLEKGTGGAQSRKNLFQKALPTGRAQHIISTLEESDGQFKTLTAEKFTKLLIKRKFIFFPRRNSDERQANPHLF
jgi:hypothetical protein